MEPKPSAWWGREAIGAFLTTVPAGGRLEQIRLVLTAANWQPALAAYILDGEQEVHRAYGVMVLTIDQRGISAITGFANPSLFHRFGLADTL